MSNQRHERAVPLVAMALLAIGLLGIAAVAVLRPFGSPLSMRGDMDAMFIEQMIPHHQDAISMAEVALTRADHPEIKRLARDIIETQSAEIDRMRTWYREWYDRSVPDSGGSFGMMGGGMMGGAADIEDLKSADEFDKAFIEAMVPHHRMGVMMSQMAGSATNRPELRDLTDSIIEGQSAEIRRMRQWYDEWY